MQSNTQLDRVREAFELAGIRTAGSVEELLANYAKDQVASGKPPWEEVLMPEFFPPSILPLSDLEPILISQMTVNKHHFGRSLTLCTTDTATGQATVLNSAVGTDGDVIHIKVFNMLPTTDARNVLPKSRVFVVKEPFFCEDSAPGPRFVAIQHPSDLVCLLENDPTVLPHVEAFRKTSPELFPSDFEDRIRQMLVANARNLKDLGNSCHLEKDYHKAIESYTCAIKVCSADDEVLRADLYRNRSLAHGELGRYELAMSDARAAMLRKDIEVLDPESLKMRNAKAFYRAGRAAYGLGDFQQAVKDFQSALDLEPGDKDNLQGLKTASARLNEAETGNVDTNALQKQHDKGVEHLDVANFMKSVSIRQAGQHGRGLFATKNIKAGEVILVEKALATCHPNEHDAVRYALFFPTNNGWKLNTSASLFFRVLDKLRFNPDLAGRFLQLHSGNYTPKYAARQLDGHTVVDIFEIHQILNVNALGYARRPGMNVDPVVIVLPSGRRVKDQELSCGLWIMASYANHACCANAFPHQYGDIKVLRATRDIAKDEEITLPYRNIDEHHAVSIKKLNNSVWSFTCDCAICLAEQTTPTKEANQREQLLQELERYPLPSNLDPPSKRRVRQVKELYKKLGQTYDDAEFTDIPRLAMASASYWLQNVYFYTNTQEQLEHWSLETLRNLGIIVTIKADGIDITRRHPAPDLRCIPMVKTLYDVSYMKRGREASITKALLKLLEQLVLVLTGDTRKFDQDYGSPPKLTFPGGEDEPMISIAGVSCKIVQLP